MDITTSIKTEFLTDIEKHIKYIVTTYSVDNDKSKDADYSHAEALYTLYKEQLDVDAYILKHAEEYIHRKRKDGTHVNFFGSSLYNTVVKYVVYWNDQTIHLKKLSEHIQNSDMSALNAVSKLFVYTVLSTLYMLAKDPDYKYDYKNLNNKYDLSNKLKNGVLTSLLNKNKSPNPYIFSNDVHATLVKYSKCILKLEGDAKIQKSHYFTIYDKLVYALKFVDVMDANTLDAILTLLKNFFKAIFAYYMYDRTDLYSYKSNEKYAYIIKETVITKYKSKYTYKHRTCIRDTYRKCIHYNFNVDNVVDALEREIVSNLSKNIKVVKIYLLNSIKSILNDIVESNDEEIQKFLNKYYNERDEYISTSVIYELYSSIL